MSPLKQPIGIFDAGLGSYAIVERVHREFPRQDIIYLADRASFPYGAKTPDALFSSVKKAVEHLASQSCAAIIVASNAPSIMVLGAVRHATTIPVIGIFPPIREALERSLSRRIAVLGVESMVTSAEMASCVAELRPHDSEVLLVNASPMVELVENFLFLNDPARTQRAVDGFMRQLLQARPDIDVMTLSSTHLPWLRPFFEAAAPTVSFIDPADSVLEAVRAFVSDGDGVVSCITTQTPALTASGLEQALRKLGFQGSVTGVAF